MTRAKKEHCLLLRRRAAASVLLVVKPLAKRPLRCSIMLEAIRTAVTSASQGFGTCGRP